MRPTRASPPQRSWMPCATTRASPTSSGPRSWLSTAATSTPTEPEVLPGPDATSRPAEGCRAARAMRCRRALRAPGRSGCGLGRLGRLGGRRVGPACADQRRDRLDNGLDQVVLGGDQRDDEVVLRVDHVDRLGQRVGVRDLGDTTLGVLDALADIVDDGPLEALDGIDHLGLCLGDGGEDAHLVAPWAEFTLPVLSIVSDRLTRHVSFVTGRQNPTWQVAFCRRRG